MKKVFINFILILSIVLFVVTENAPAQMYWNNACSFAGSNSSYLSRGNSNSLNISGSFTIEAWIKPANSLIPSFQSLVQKREGNNPNGYNLYLYHGKIAIRTNSTTKLIGKTVLENNEWTHVSARYDFLSGLFSISLNGIVDTSATVAGGLPVGNTDSLYIGKGLYSPFEGQLDEIRIWNKALTPGENYRYRRLSLGTNTGLYNGLVLSLTFQDNEGNGDPFSLIDWSGSSNNILNRGVTAVDLSNMPSQTINTNETIDLNGSGDYLAAPDQIVFSPQNTFTIEAWIYPRSFSLSKLIVQKGSPTGIVSNYSLRLNNANLLAIVNNNIVMISDDQIPLNKWSHIAFVYDGISGSNYLYINGKLTDVSTNNNAAVTNGTDSLYIGGTPNLTGFDGFIDEFRFKNSAKSEKEINSYLFRSIDEFNDLPGFEAVYNFDGYLTSSVGGLLRMNFRNNAGFSHLGQNEYTPSSPLIRDDNINFGDGYYLKHSDRRIPETGTMGDMISDTLNIFLDESIYDVNVFVSLNHSRESDLTITLYGPDEKNVVLINNNGLISNSNDIVTIFNDQAESDLVNGQYVSFSPSVKAHQNINSIFSGDNSSGKWKLVINDNSDNETGRLIGWGIQINNKTSIQNLLSVKSLIQGFYDPSTNLMAVSDTMRFTLRDINAPYSVIDSSKGIIQPNGEALASFNNVQIGDFYYVQINHRNSIETWSTIPFAFEPLTSQAEYDFKSSIIRAYGENMIQVDDSPNRFAFYSGDENQNGIVDLTDVVNVFNDANAFVNGYVSSDMNGDDFSDLTDVVITINNANVFVAAIIP